MVDDHRFEEEPEFEPIRRLRPDDPDWTPDLELDTSDVHITDVDMFRPEPDWVITQGYTDEELGTVKTGKEADVTLVRRTAGKRSCLVVYKTYRPREHRAFRREEAYREGQSFGDDRIDRAVRRRSKVGRAVLEYAWAYREYPMLRRVWDAGLQVPFPIEEIGETLVMEYIGDESRAAPRLAETKLDPDAASSAYEQCIEQIRRLLDLYLVHGDLSPYNVLWWESTAWLIDFPQAMDITSGQGLDMLRRDVRNICRWYRRFDPSVDDADVFADVLRTAPFG